ncbi:hypothetical protein THAOC_08399, partial [Thalassiosira oceanica]
VRRARTEQGAVREAQCARLAGGGGKSPRLCVYASSSALTRIIENMKDQ